MSSSEAPSAAPSAAMEAKKKPTASKEKKVAPAHPPYFQMIKEAMAAGKEKGGMSAYAIAKFMEEKYKAVLPTNYKKTLNVQLRSCVAKGKVVKVKESFKLSESGRKKKKPAPAGARKEKKSSAAAVVEKESKKRKRAAGAPAAKPKVKKPVKKAKKVTPVKPKSIKSPSKRARKAAA